MSNSAASGSPISRRERFSNFMREKVASRFSVERSYLPESIRNNPDVLSGRSNVETTRNKLLSLILDFQNSMETADPSSPDRIEYEAKKSNENILNELNLRLAEDKEQEYKLDLEIYAETIKTALESTTPPTDPEKIKEIIYKEILILEAENICQGEEDVLTKKKERESGLAGKIWGKLRGMTNQAVEKYRRLPAKYKIILSFGLIGAGVAGSAFSGGFLASASALAIGGGLTMRFLSNTTFGALSSELAERFRAHQQRERNIDKFLDNLDDNYVSQLEEKLDKILGEVKQQKKSRKWWALGGALAGVALAEVARFGIKSAIQNWASEPAQPATVPATAAEPEPAAEPAATPEIDQPSIKPAITKGFSNVIEGTRGMDYESKSLMQLIEQHKTELGYNPSTDGDPDKWMRHEFRTAMAELKAKGQWYDSTHGGDQVSVRLNADGSHEYYFENASDIKPAYELPHHAHAEPTQATQGEAPQTPAEATEPVKAEVGLTDAQEGALDDIRSTYENTTWPLKNSQAIASVKQNWEVLFPGQDFDKSAAKELLADIKESQGIDSQEALHSYVSPGAEAATAADSAGGEAPTEEAVKAELQPEPDKVEKHVDTHLTASDTLKINSDTTQLSPEALKGVDTVYYHPVANYSGIWNEPITEKVAMDLSPYTPDQKMQILQLIRLLNVASFMGPSPEQVGLGVAPDADTFAAFVNNGEALSWLYDTQVEGKLVDLADPAMPKGMNPQEWEEYIATHLLRNTEQRMAAK